MMLPTYSNRIASFHLHRCDNSQCPHKDICYHKKRNYSSDRYIYDDELESVYVGRYVMEDALRAGCLVYDAHCSFYFEYEQYDYIMNRRRNYNLTVSSIHKGVENLNRNQTQVTVYSLEQVRQFHEFQKLFLVKDFGTLETALRIVQRDDVGRVHFPIDATFFYICDNIYRNRIMSLWRDSKQFTIDTCIMSWIINGECPYTNGRYADISDDQTVRGCPFNPLGFVIRPADRLDEIFEQAAIHCDITLPCKYAMFFQKKAQ